MDDSLNQPPAPSVGERPAAEQPPRGTASGGPPAGGPMPQESSGGKMSRSPVVPWSPWTAPAALLSGLALALVGGLVVDIPALALGVSITTSHVPAGLEIADTVVQDGAFILAAILFARVGGHTVRAWQFG